MLLPLLLRFLFIMAPSDSLFVLCVSVSSYFFAEDDLFFLHAFVRKCKLHTKGGQDRK